MKLLLIEDNKRLSEDIMEFLKGNGFIIELADHYIKASEKINLYEYDLVILDLGLPDGNGLDLIPELTIKDPHTGILILTAKHSLELKVKGLNLGADDYLTKPFHKSELNARIHSILRRKKANGTNVIQIGEYEIDTNARQAKIGDEVLNLTRKEFDLLLFFTYNKNRLLTKENIAEHLWGDHYDQSDNFDFIYNHIKNLRYKISKAKGKNYIKSMYGMGYKFEIFEGS